MAKRRELFVISDLHLGGAPAESGSERGYAICTRGKVVGAFIRWLLAGPGSSAQIELVINGDFVDFLAEKDVETSSWSALKSNAAAVHALRAICSREGELFAAIAALIGAGHRLTLLLGNHDVELSFPDVRRVLAQALGSNDFQFFYDGEAYCPVGEVLIEHGNRYDTFNMNDYDGLRRTRSVLSRGLSLDNRNGLEASPGSRLVAEVINPLKASFPILDLLKPESEAVVPILLAVNPDAKGRIGDILLAAARARRHRLSDSVTPNRLGDISASSAPPMSGQGDLSTHDVGVHVENNPVAECLKRLFGNAASDFERSLRSEGRPAPIQDGDISSGWRANVDHVTGLLRLLTMRGDGDQDEQRIQALLQSLQVAGGMTVFDRSVEGNTPYRAAADTLARAKRQCVIFGHTHLARDIILSNGTRYINTGTWADLAAMPPNLFEGDRSEKHAAVRHFLTELLEGRVMQYVQFIPTYAHLVIDENEKVTSITLEEFPSSAVPDATKS